MDFNDFFLVVRNATMAQNVTNPATPPLEETYQMVSNNFTLLRDRNLLNDPATVGNMSR